MATETVPCPCCGRPYCVYDMFAGDQSACPACRQEARGGSLAERIAGRRADSAFMERLGRRVAADRHLLNRMR